MSLFSTPSPQDQARKVLDNARANHDRAQTQFNACESALQSAVDFDAQHGAAQALAIARTMFNATKAKLDQAEQDLANADRADLVARRDELKSLTSGDALLARLQPLVEAEVKLRVQLLAALDARESLFVQLKTEAHELQLAERELDGRVDYMPVAIETTVKNLLDRLVNAAVDAQVTDRNRAFFAKVA